MQQIIQCKTAKKQLNIQVSSSANEAKHMLQFNEKKFFGYSFDSKVAENLFNKKKQKSMHFNYRTIGRIKIYLMCKHTTCLSFQFSTNRSISHHVAFQSLIAARYILFLVWLHSAISSLNFCYHQSLHVIISLVQY